MANTSNLSSLTTDFNVTPYYDDYDPTDNYYRILFKPGYAVQARELTQMQSIQQKQIDRFGKHMFRDGSIVLPGQFNIELNTDYVKIKDTDNANGTVSISQFKNETLRGVSTNIEAFVLEAEDGTETSANTKTLMIRYLSASNTNSAITVFQTNEVLISNSGATLIVANTANATGKGSIFSISSGVFFAKEHFIGFPTSTVVLDRYNTAPSKRVGFFIGEEITTYEDDTNLLDPALEASNYAAPGADRLKLNPILTALNIDDESEDFVELFSIKDGVVTELYSRPQYNILQDELAKRTLDESGDYYVGGLNVRIRENFDSNTNGGLSLTGDSNLLSIGVEAGTAYVKGYEVNKLVTEYISINKATTYENVSGQAATVTMGNYLPCNEFVGYVKHDEGTTIYLRDVAQKRVSVNKEGINIVATGNTIGTARLKSIEYSTGTLGAPSGNVLVYLTDIRMLGTNNFTNVRSLNTATFITDVVLSPANTAVLRDTAADTLLYYVGSSSVKDLKDTAGQSDTLFNFKRTRSDITLTPAGATSFTLTTGSAAVNERFPYGTTTLTNGDKEDIIVNILADANLSISGTASGTGGTTTVTGAGTTFLTKLNVGDKIRFSGNNYLYTIASITGDTTLTTVEAIPNNLTGNTIVKVYKNGDAIDLRLYGNTGAIRTVSATPSQLTIDLKDSFEEQVPLAVTYQLARNNAIQIAKTLTSNVYVKINVASSLSGRRGPFNLGVSDVYRIQWIRKDSSEFSNTTAGSNVTTSFVLDNGQRDSYYDHATITPSSPLSLTDHLLVKLDYFEPDFTSGRGYFSVDSYPINDGSGFNGFSQIRTENIPVFSSPITKQQYDLRNYIDFRPVKANTATIATTVSDATVNPSRSDGFAFEAAGLRLPVPASQFTYDYSYYLPRRDLIVMDRNGLVYSISGISRARPITPIAPENVMTLASIYVAPFPSLAANYAQIIGRTDLACVVKKLSNIRYTMRDIGVLNDRIDSLEYYASLTLLQTDALNLKILDENGLDRFKNGIFVDTFADHTSGDISNPDYRIVVDPTEKSIRPVYTSTSINYDYLAGESSGVTKTGDIITRPYSHAVLIDQPAVTTERNVELSSYRFIGNIYLNPSLDVWVDTKQLPDYSVLLGGTPQIPQPVTEWNEWQSRVVGYQVDRQQGIRTSDIQRNGQFVYGGSFSSLSGLGSSIISSPNSQRDQRVVITSQQTRTGTTTSYGIKEDKNSLGNKVVDVALVPYIKPQVIKADVRGLKAFTKVFVFFDGEDMTKYCTPLTESQYADGLRGWATRYSAGSEGSTLVTDGNGQVLFGLRIPVEGKKFTVGAKEVVVTDSPTNAQDASTYAKTNFYAQGLVQQKQNTILTTRSLVKQTTTVKQELTSTQVKFIDNPSCSAYSFIPRLPETEDGCFLTKVDVYFSRKHPKYGVWIEIREMDSAGGITRTQVPFSEVWVSAANLTISPDGITSPHTFTFPSPVFLQNNVQYAFVIHTIGLNPDTYFWVSRLGETDRRTGKQVTSRPRTGTFYTTNNNLNWNMVDDIDLRCTFYRANFTIGTGFAVIGNKPVEKLKIINASNALNTYGENLTGYNKLTLSATGTNTFSSIVVGDRLIGQTSGANSSVISLNSGLSTVNVSNTLFQTNELVRLFSSTMVNKANAFTITNESFGIGQLTKYVDYGGNTFIEMVESNGSFFATEVITGEASGGTAIVDAVQDFRYSVVDFEPTYLTFNNTQISFEMRPTANGTSPALRSYVPITENDNYYFDEEMAVLSRTNEVAKLGSARSNRVKINMSTTSRFVSPVFDLPRAQTIFVDNIVNANVSATSNVYSSYPLEIEKSGGEVINKYISNPVTLAEGQDAEDLNVILTAYKPPSTDVIVFVKILNGEDSDLFSDIDWIPLEKLNERAASSLSDRNDFKEYTYKFPSSMLTGTQGQVQYVNSEGITFTGFKYFAVKIALTATNSAIVPRVADLRAIALQI